MHIYCLIFFQESIERLLFHFVAMDCHAGLVAMPQAFESDGAHNWIRLTCENEDVSRYALYGVSLINS